MNKNVIIFFLREDFDHLYMGLAIGNQNLSNIGETKSVVYRWLGGHFDIVDNLAASDARKVVEFTIGSERFIIIANYRNKHGNIKSNLI